jgi:hypothetical protein
MMQNVNRPTHYRFGEIEVIDFIEQIVAHYPPEIGYHIGNAIKYLARAPHKGKLSEDLLKAEFYIKRAANKSLNLKRPALQAVPDAREAD